MKLYPNQLAEHLKKSLSPIYLVSGDETLLVQESCDLIRQAAARQGFDERERLTVDASFDWQQLLSASQNLSLFSQQQLLELHLSKKPNDKGKALLEYCENPPEDKILLIISNKLDGATKRTKWYKSVEKIGITLALWPIERSQLPAWLQQRVRARGLQIEQQSLQAIADSVEGNLLAADQTIEKLYLRFGNDAVSHEDILSSLSDSSRYDVFKLLDSAMNKDPKRASKILTGLRQEGVDPILILWALAKQCRQLATMAYSISQGENFATVCQKQGIWDKQKPLIKKALDRRRETFFQKCLLRAAKIDEMIKGVTPGNIWDALHSTLLLLAK